MKTGTHQLQLQLPSDLYSPDQLTAIIMELRGLISEERDARVRVAKNGVVVPPAAIGRTSALLLGVLHNAGITKSDPTALESLLARLETLRAKSPVAHITLADLPNRMLKRTLTEWFRQNIDPHVMLTFSVRADIGGGAIVQAGSHMYDFSFRKHIMGNRAKIGEIFDRVRK